MESACYTADVFILHHHHAVTADEHGRYFAVCSLCFTFCGAQDGNCFCTKQEEVPVSADERIRSVQGILTFKASTSFNADFKDVGQEQEFLASLNKYSDLHFSVRLLL